MIHVDESDPVGEIQPSFPYRDVTIKRGADAKEFYELMSEIGRGKFGTVYRCKEKSTGLELAAKFVAVPRKEDRRNVEREVDIMKTLQHPRLIQLYDAFDHNKVMCVILELILGGELFERVIDDDFVLTEKACAVFMRQICEGIEFVHSNNVLHLDLKPENILCLSKTGNRIKIIDFGLARRFDPEKKLQVLFGTPEFVAPEVVNFDSIDFGTDMWSVGVICYVLLSGLSPFMGETDIETMANVTIAKYDFEDEAFKDISEKAKDFITRLLLKEKPQRLTASQCLAHSWLQRKPPVLPSPAKSFEPVNANHLDVTKDNLRMFVERWGEHPDSPYLFDTNSHEILQLPNSGGFLAASNSQQSLRGLSPSPCGSLGSSPDSVVHVAENSSNSLEEQRFRSSFDQPPYGTNRRSEYLHAFERRASDSSCVVRRNDASCNTNLANEIRQLSDRLFMLASINTDINNSDNKTNSTNKQERKTGVKQKPKIAEKPTNLGLPKRVLPTVIKKVCEGINNNEMQQRSEPVTSNVPWARRTKFKITNMNRDVPIGSQNSTSTFIKEFISTPTEGFQKSLKTKSSSRDVQESATDTKDCLLHLLGKWDDQQPQQPQHCKSNGRHQSVSVEWSESDALRQHTMSSINTFFKRQSSVNQIVNSSEQTVTGPSSSTVKKKTTVKTFNGIRQF